MNGDQVVELVEARGRIASSWGPLFREVEAPVELGGGSVQLGEVFIGEWLAVFFDLPTRVVWHRLAVWMEDDPDWVEGRVSAALPGVEGLPDGLTWEELLRALDGAEGRALVVLSAECERRLVEELAGV